MEFSILFFAFIGIVFLVLIVKMTASGESKKHISSGNIVEDLNQPPIDNTAHHHQQVHEQFDQTVQRLQQEQTALSHHQEFSQTVQQDDQTQFSPPPLDSNQ